MKVDIFGWVRDALSENGIIIKSIERENNRGSFELDFSEHDKAFDEEIDRLNKINDSFLCEIKELENNIEALKNTIRLFAKKEVHHD